MISKSFEISNPIALRRKILSVMLMFCMLHIPLIDSMIYASGSPATMASGQADSAYQLYSPQQLDNLLAPIALYPDPLLAQVLPAATFPDQIEEAARYVRANGTDGVDNQYWDVSVKAVAHYPSVLNMMADRIDWTTATGQAYVYQSTDVMTAVQRLRGMAHAQGNLISTPQQEVVVNGGYIVIVPAQPRYVYVPVYDPAVIYSHHVHVGVGIGVAISFGVGFVIGAWLNRDCDWRYHRVYYHGWNGGGWIGRSRPVIHVTNVYVNNHYTNININRTVTTRKVNYTSINRYNSVHHEVTFDNHARNRALASPNRGNDKVVNSKVSAHAANNRPPGQGSQGHPPSGKPASQAVKAGPQSPNRQSAPSTNQSQSRSVNHGNGKGRPESHAATQQAQKSSADHSKGSESGSKRAENADRKRP